MTRVADVESFGEGLPDAELVKIIRNRRDEESVLGALKELIRRESPVRPGVFQEVLEEPAYSTAARNTVVTALGNELVPGGQQLLIRHLAAAKPSTFAKAVLALGRIGDGEALEALEEIRPPDDATARRALELAKSLLAYRLRLDRHLLALPADYEVVPLEHGIPCQAGNADPESVREALSDVKIPGLTLSAEGAAEIDCQGVPLLLVFTDDFSSPDQLATIMDRNALPLVMLKKATSLERYALDGYFFTHPHDGEGARLLGTRPGGDPTYVGEVRAVDRGYAFAVRALSSRYAVPIEVEGRYVPGERSWEFTKVLTGSSIAAPSGSPRRAPRYFTTEPENPSSEANQDLIRRAMRFPMDKVLFRYCRDTGLSIEVARQHERELKRFLALTAIGGRPGYGMRGPIDGLWHTFLCFTKMYARFCREVAGRFLHHFPNISGFELVDERQRTETLDLGPREYLRFLKDYEAVFGEPAPEQLWPRPAGTEIGVYAAAECASDDCGNTCGADTGDDTDGGTGGTDD